MYYCINHHTVYLHGIRIYTRSGEMKSEYEKQCEIVRLMEEIVNLMFKKKCGCSEIPFHIFFKGHWSPQVAAHASTIWPKPLRNY